MPSTRDLRRRIRSVKNTSQITKAMQMVAASKMRRAQQRATDGHPFAVLLNRVLVSLNDRVDPSIHPLLEHREVKKELTIVVSTDKGLCGALNTNLFREISHQDREKTEYVGCGRKGVIYLARTKRNLVADFNLPDMPAFRDTRPISKFVIERFLSGDVDKVSVLFSRFVNTLTQEPRLTTVLPISALPVNQERTDEEPDSQYEFEPDAAVVLDEILPYYIHYAIYQMVLDARASEHSARMVAMKNATDNANSLVKDLNLEYNRVRQAAITTELLEISTAQAAME